MTTVSYTSNYYIHCFSYIALGFWVSGFQVSRNLKTNGNQWKPGNDFSLLLILPITGHHTYPGLDNPTIKVILIVYLI